MQNEFAKMLLRQVVKSSPPLNHSPSSHSFTGNVFPHGLSWDWRTHSAVIGPVQNQGKVGGLNSVSFEPYFILCFYTKVRNTPC